MLIAIPLGPEFYVRHFIHHFSNNHEKPIQNRKFSPHLMQYLHGTTSYGILNLLKGNTQEAVEILRNALDYEKKVLKPNSIYRSYCNAGLFCLYSFKRTGDKAYLVEGKKHAKKALHAATKRTKEGSSESLMDTFDILILLSKLALAEKQRLRCQFYLFRAARCLSQSSYRDTLIDIAYNYDFTKKWEVLLLKFTNLFLHSYENIYALDEQ